MNQTSAINPGSCGYCGMIHQGPCPRIKAIEYYPDGFTIKRVEYYDLRNAVGIEPNPYSASAARLISD